ncbi:unnamed protein product (mitochondrion) [Musa banksii]
MTAHRLSDRPRDQLLPGPSMNELCRLLFRPLHVVSTRPRPSFARPMHVVLTKTPLFLPWVGVCVFIRYAARVCCAILGYVLCRAGVPCMS